MNKLLFSTLCLLALAFAAHATTWEGGGSQDVTIGVTIPGYAQVNWQDTDILFTDVAADQATGDWYNTTLLGQYLHNYDKASTDPWATGYFESYDGAHFYVATNTDIYADITANGDLDDGAGGTIPTWFTTAFSGHFYNGFLMGSSWYGYDNIPLDGAGVYGNESGANMILETSAVFPNQHAFDMDGGPWTLSLDAVSRGTMEFKARIQRTGLGEWESIPDAAGAYSTTINVTFGEP